MDKANLLLAALASGNVETYTPEDVQSLLFLVSRQFPETIDPPPFNFTLWGHGPFDPRVNELLEELALDSYLSVTRQEKRRDVTLTTTGRTRAAEMLDQLSSEEVEYMRRASRFVAAKSTRILTVITDKADRTDTGSPKSGWLQLKKKEPE